MNNSARDNPARRRVGNALMQFLRWSGTATSYAARQLNLNRTDMLCIRYLLNTGDPVSPKQIMQELGLSSSSATELLDRLQRYGYIRRSPNPADRRGVLIELDREHAAEPIAFFSSVEQLFLKALSRRSEAELLAMAEFFEEVTTDEAFGPAAQEE